MYSTSGHQLVVNEYFAECLRKAQESEAQRDAETRRLHGHDSGAPRADEATAPPALKPI